LDAKAYAEKVEEERIEKLDFDVQSLVGLNRVFILPIINLSEHARSVGLTPEQLKMDVVFRLGQAGIKLYSHAEFLESEGMPSLCVIIDSIDNDYSVPYTIRLCFSQQANLVRKPHRVIQCAMTWDKPVVGTSPNTTFAKEVRHNLGVITDLFINDYFIANPKK
jgi:hypothetical protein